MNYFQKIVISFIIILIVLYIGIFAYQQVIECDKLLDDFMSLSKNINKITDILNEQGDYMTNDWKTKFEELDHEGMGYAEELVEEYRIKCS